MKPIRGSHSTSLSELTSNDCSTNSWDYTSEIDYVDETPKIKRRKSIDVSKIELQEDLSSQEESSIFLMPSIKISQYNSQTKLNNSVISLQSFDY